MNASRPDPEASSALDAWRQAPTCEARAGASSRPPAEDVLATWRGESAPGAPLDDQIRRAWRRRLWWVVPPAFAGPVASDVLRDLSGHERAHARPEPFWLLLVALVLLVVMFVIVGVAAWQRQRGGDPLPRNHRCWR